MPSKITPFNILSQLPNELLFLVLQDLHNEDIETLCTIPQIKSRIQNLFCVISDISTTRYFHHIEHAFNLKQFIDNPELLQFENANNNNNGGGSGGGGILWAIVEVNDLQNSAIHLPKISKLIKNRISIYDDYIPVTMEEGVHGTGGDNTYRSWMQNLNKNLTNLVVFENLGKLDLSDLSLNPKLFRFPKLMKLKLTRCESDNETNGNAAGCYFDFPNLKYLSIEGRMKSLNSSIDFPNAKFTHLTLIAISDMDTWSNINNSSIEQLTILQSNSLVNFRGLSLKEVRSFVIKDTDLVSLSHWDCPKLTNLHLEQLINSTVGIHDLNLPSLVELLVWVFQLEQFYNVQIPNIARASIMLHTEPVPGPVHHRIDFTPFKGIKTLQICEAGEILAFCDSLEHLEVRGPFVHESLFNCHFQSLRSLDIYFNNSLRELPRIIAPSLEKLSISRCTSLNDISAIQIYYPKLKDFYCEYSVLSLIQNIDFPTLTNFHYMSSAMNQSIKIVNCSFPSLQIFEAKNLEARSLEMSVIQLDFAPRLSKLMINNFNMKELQISNHANLKQVCLNACIENLNLVNCQGLERLDLSKNPSLRSLRTSPFPNLVSLLCDRTPGIKSFRLETPLLQRVEYDEMVWYVKRSPDIVNDD